MRQRPLVAVAAFWLAGVSVPSIWHGGWQAAALAGTLLLLLGAWLSGWSGARLAAVCAAALLLAFSWRSWTERSDRSDLTALWIQEIPASAEISGVISSPPEIDGDLAAFRLSARNLRTGPGKSESRIRETVVVHVKLESAAETLVAADWKRGDAVTVAGTPEQPGPAGNFGAFDYRRYLEGQGIRWQWDVRGIESVKRMEAKVPLLMLPLRCADELRSRIGRLMDRLYPRGDAGFMKGLVAGIPDEVDPALYDAFSRLGLTHVLAISGLHVAVVVFALLRLAAMLGCTRERAIDIAFVSMPVYMLLTGASPSAVRACLMAMLALALARRHHLKDGLHLLAAAAIAMSAWNPRIVENVSFQLSFAVTAGLLLFTPTVTAMLERIRPRILRDALAVGITAQAASFPLSVYYFHGFHLLSLPANLVLVPFLSFLVMPLGMASVLLGAAWAPAGTIPAVLATYGNAAAFRAVELLDRATELRTVWPQPSRAWVAASYVLIGGSLWLWRRREERRRESDWYSADGTEPEEDRTAPLAAVPAKRTGRKAGATAAMVLLAAWSGWWLWGYRPDFLDADAAVQFLDVGQGDAILIRTGEGHRLLVDAGGSVSFRKPGEEWRERRNPYEIGRKLIVPLLRQRGVRELDALVLTHLDADHIGGAEAVIREVPVRALLWNGTWKPGAAAERLFREAEKRNVPVYAVRAGMEWRLDDTAVLRVLYPDPDPETEGEPAAADSPRPLRVLEEQNRQSVVMLLTIYGRKFLLTGDAETAAETAIMAGEPEASPSSLDVMKAGHHGSKTSTGPAWLAYWRPAEVVISAGRRNVYGHPHPSVVGHILSAGSELLRTDRDGEIQYRISPAGNLYRRVKFGESANVPSPAETSE